MSNFTFKILSLLADGHFHSGTKLAEQLGCSRGTIWKQIQSLQALGIDYDAVPHRGYRLKKPFDLLNFAGIQQQLKNQGSPLSVIYKAYTASTNTDLLQLSKEGSVEPTALMCEYQTAGRGRHGRTWGSRPGDALMCSVLWRFNGRVDAISTLTLAVGVSIVRILHQKQMKAIGLKWPNDLVIRQTGAKVGGILIDIQGDLLGPCVAVIGFGLNVHQAPQLSASSYQAASLSDISPLPLSRSELLADLLIQLSVDLKTFEQTHFSAFAEDWNALAIGIGESMEVTLPTGEKRFGEFKGIDAGGALLLQEENQPLCPIVNGDITLRENLCPSS